jgi:hypothetical protein
MAWWDSCNDMKRPPEGCFQIWIRPFTLKWGMEGYDVYAWRDPWQDPVTAKVWPAPPIISEIEPRRLSDARIREMIRTYRDPELIAALRAEVMRRREILAA